MKYLPILLLFILLALPVYAKDYTPDECPVVGNKESGIYHVLGGFHYEKMLRENQEVKDGKKKDNRECFRSDEDAEKAGYRASKL